MSDTGATKISNEMKALTKHGIDKQLRPTEYRLCIVNGDPLPTREITDRTINW